MTAPTPEQMRALADWLDAFGAGSPQQAMPEKLSDSADALRAAADQLNALQLLSLDEQTATIRRIDREFGAAGGGSSRHWVDYLNRSGYQIVQVPNDRPGEHGRIESASHGEMFLSLYGQGRSCNCWKVDTL